MHIFFNISRIKGNQTITFGQLIGYIKRNARNEAGRLVQGKNKWYAAWLPYILIALKLT